MGGEEAAREAYDAFSPIYDAFTAANDYETYLGAVLLPELERLGLRRPAEGGGRRALDLGCGTGRAFEPLWARGWTVTGCDLSAEMLHRARARYGDRDDLELRQEGLLEMPRLGPAFDLALALNDVLNCLTADGDLERAFAGIAANLAPAGRLVVDLASLGTLRAACGTGAPGVTVGSWRLRGRTAQVVAGGIGEYEISGAGVRAHVHRVRHWRRPEVVAALEAAGLRCLAVAGLEDEAGALALREDADDEVDPRLVYFAGRA